MLTLLKSSNHSVGEAIATPENSTPFTFSKEGRNLRRAISEGQITPILIFVIIFASGCSSLSLTNYIDKTEPNTNPIIEPFTPTNGIDGKDGKDGDSINLYEIYQQLVALNECDGTFAQFVKDYLSVEDSAYATNKGLNL